MSTKKILFIGLLGAVFLMVFVFIRTKHYSSDSNTSIEGVSSSSASSGLNLRQQPSTTESDGKTASSAQKANPTSNDAPDYLMTLRKSHDYLATAASIHQAAVDGDRDAQYVLGFMIGHCEQIGQVFFTRNQKRLNLDEALQYSSQVHRSEALTRLEFARCYAMSDPQNMAQFGKSEDWVKKASDAGQPAAETELALQIMEGENSKSGDPKPSELFLDALKSKDPTAIFNIGNAQGLFDQSANDKQINQYAWWLASCEMGNDCGPDADWMRMICQQEGCPVGLSGQDFIRTIARGDWQLVEQRAREITTALSEGDWASFKFN